MMWERGVVMWEREGDKVGEGSGDVGEWRR